MPKPVDFARKPSKAKGKRRERGELFPFGANVIGKRRGGGGGGGKGRRGGKGGGS